MKKMTKKSEITRAIIDAKRKPSFLVVERPSIIAQYFRDLNKIVQKMSRLVREKLIPLLERNEVRFAKTANGVVGLQVVNDDLFGTELLNAYDGILSEFEALDRQARRIAIARLTQANKANRRDFVAAFKRDFGIDVKPLLSESIMVSGELLDRDTILTVKEAVEENVKLIKSIPEQHLSKIQDAIERGLQSGDDAYSLKDVIKRIDDIDDQTKRRAKLIARDQLQKLTGNLNQARQRAVGIRGYIWRTSADERVRESHRDNDGKRFQWDKAPSGTGHPGEDINCRCVAEPDFSELIPSLAPELEKLGPRRRNRISV